MEPLDADVAVVPWLPRLSISTRSSTVNRDFLGDVDEHGDDHLVVQARRPADDVEVTVRYRVERTRTYHPRHAATPLLRFGQCAVSPGLLPASAAAASRTRRWPHRTCATLPSAVAGGPVNGPDLVARSTIDERAMRQPALRRAAQHAATRPRRSRRTAGRRTRGRSRRGRGAALAVRPDRHVRPGGPEACGGAAAQHPFHPVGGSTAPGRPTASTFALITARRAGVGLHQQHVRRAARQGFEADRARARVQVQDAQPAEGTELGHDRGEQPLPGPVARRPGPVARRNAQPSPACRPGDDPCHGLVCSRQALDARSRAGECSRRDARRRSAAWSPLFSSSAFIGVL